MHIRHALLRLACSPGGGEGVIRSGACITKDDQEGDRKAEARMTRHV